MSPSYLVVYWDRAEGSRRSVEANEFPKVSRARRELRERGYRRDYGNASKDEVEEYTRQGYERAPAASITRISSGARVFAADEPSLLLTSRGSRGNARALASAPK